MCIRDASGIVSSIVYGPDDRTRLSDATDAVVFTTYAPSAIGRDAVAAQLEVIASGVRAVSPAAIVESLEVFPSTLPTRRESAYAAWVAISVGCNNTCTFCIVPSLRGKEKDRRPGDVLAEVEALVAEGVIEVTLLGAGGAEHRGDLPPHPACSGVGDRTDRTGDSDHQQGGGDGGFGIHAGHVCEQGDHQDRSAAAEQSQE